MFLLKLFSLLFSSALAALKATEWALFSFFTFSRSVLRCLSSRHFIFKFFLKRFIFNFYSFHILNIFSFISKLFNQFLVLFVKLAPSFIFILFHFQDILYNFTYSFLVCNNSWRKLSTWISCGSDVLGEGEFRGILLEEFLVYFLQREKWIE